MVDRRTKTDAQYLDDLKRVHGGTILPLEDYVNAKIAIKHQHICGHIWKPTPNRLLNGHGCPKCSKIRKTNTQYLQQVKLIHGNNLHPIDEYIDGTTPIRHKHKCGHVWKPIPSNILKGAGCPKCYLKEKLTTERQYKRELRTAHGADVILVGKYVNRKTPTEHQHKCGHVWITTPNSVLYQRSGCPKCGRHGQWSKLAEECIAAIARRSRLKFKTFCNGGEHKVYIPEWDKWIKVDGYNKGLNLGIEFHGDRWHGWHDKRTKAYRKTIKRDRLLSKQVRLIVIWEHEWRTDPEKVLKRVMKVIANLK